jgi:hypothetical protein
MASELPSRAVDSCDDAKSGGALACAIVHVEEPLMSDRRLIGAIAGTAAVLTLVQLLWMFGMFSPADALAGRTGFLYAGMIAAWFWGTLGLLVAVAIILLMTGSETVVGRPGVREAMR